VTSTLHPELFWPIIGEFSKSIALASALFAIVLGIVSLRSSSDRLHALARRSIYACFFFNSLAILVLVSCFLTDNYWLRYVYAYSNHAMPVIYKITALWGGQDGSLLFWLWISSAYSAAAVFFHRKSDAPLIPGIVFVFGIIQTFFSAIILYSDNPFELFPFKPEDGRGLNPLLQNASMAIHPPSLYLGYVGMSVPFAFAISALLSNRLSVRWITASRIWTLIAWFWLSVGNLLGAQWAYVELGWGGFWGWDPVENAAILPWFTASAFLHSVMIQEKRGMLKFWNMHLIVISFALTILGTYLTRSGVVQSVHSFASSDVGYFFLGFLAVILILSGILIYYRREGLKAENIFESFLSKESAFVVNNIVLVGSAFIILWSTLFPTASELILGRRIIVGPPFFNQILAPVGIVLLILTGVGPAIAWRKASKKNLNESFIWPVILGVIAAGALALLQIYDWYVLLTGFGAAFVMTSIGMEFYRGAKSRITAYQEKPLRACINAVRKNHRKYGGYIVHLGIVSIFVGIAGGVYREVFEFELKVGQTVEFENYSIQYKGLDQRKNSNQEENYALLDLYQGDKLLREVRPAKFFYYAQQQPSTEVDIYSRVKEDVYFILGSFDPLTNTVKVRVILQPFIFWLWMGGLILVVGSMIAMSPSLKFESVSLPERKSA